jgi:hypothetical protein
MLSRFLQVVALAFLAGALACTGQDAPQQTPEMQPPAKRKAPTGILTGTVYCADTNLPARLTAIYLVQISENSFGTRSAGISDLEGRFAIGHVREGNYYVVAVLPGYLNFLSSLTKSHLDAMTADERKKLLSQVPGITISADQPAQLSIRLERGGEIDGTVMYDDGSPAIGLRMSFKLKSGHESNGVLPIMMAEEAIYSQTGPPMTDDRGHFRILGVPPGEYIVSASFPAESAEQPKGNRFAEMVGASFGAVDVYLGGGLRASKAETIKVTAGESRDADITIPLSKLHSIRGHVVLKSTGQPPPAAFVQLIYTDTQEPARSALAPNGEFEIHFVPEGNFILRAAANPEPVPEMSIGDDDDEGVGRVVSETAFSFSVNPTAGKMEGAVEIPLLVSGDADRVNIAVPDPPARQKGLPGSNDEPDTTQANPSDKSQ